MKYMSFYFGFKIIRPIVAKISLTLDCHNKSFGKTSHSTGIPALIFQDEKKHFASEYRESREKKEKRKKSGYTLYFL